MSMAGHEQRLKELTAAFVAANQKMVDRLLSTSDSAAERSIDQGWSSAQIGWHVAATNRLLAQILEGSAASPALLGQPEFTDAQWGPGVIPPKIESPEPLVPPPTMTRVAAIRDLESAQEVVCRAIAALSADRAAHERAFVLFGNLTLYQVADLIGRHVMKHLAQAERTLASGL